MEKIQQEQKSTQTAGPNLIFRNLVGMVTTTVFSNTCTVCDKPLSFFPYIFGSKIMRYTFCDDALRGEAQSLVTGIEEAYRTHHLTRELANTIVQHMQAVKMPEDRAQPVFSRLSRLSTLILIQEGEIPVIHLRDDFHLDADEVPHLDETCTYHKPNKTVQLVPGRFIAINKRLYFLPNADKAGHRIDWNNIAQIKQKDTNSLQVKLLSGTGSDTYETYDAEYVTILLRALVAIWKRTLVRQKEEAAKGATPQHVKAAVYTRDQGCCRKCGYSGEYLEYDHIRPRSKGGANTIENIQLLCRRCNSQKSNKIEKPQ